MLFELGDFKDSEELIYNKAVSFLDSSTDKVNVAVEALFRLGDYKDSKEQLYNKAIKLTGVSYSSDNITAGVEILTRLDDYKDSEEKIQETNYNQAMKLFDKGEFEEAAEEFKKLEGYKDSAEKVKEALLNKFVPDCFLDNKFLEKNRTIDDLEKYGGTPLSGDEIKKTVSTGSWMYRIGEAPQSVTFNADGSTVLGLYGNGRWGTIINTTMKWSVENDVMKTQSSYTFNGQSKDFAGSFKLIKMSNDVIVAYNPTSKLIMNIYIAKDSNLAKICMKEYRNR